MPEVIVLPFLFATIGFVVWTIASSWQRSRHAGDDPVSLANHRPHGVDQGSLGSRDLAESGAAPPMDAQRKAAAPIDLGERVQVGIGVAGGLALVAWLSRQLPDASFSATITAVLVASVLLLVSAAAFSVWTLLSEK